MQLAEGKPCLMAGHQESGAIVVHHSESVAEELHTRRRQVGQDPKEWVNKIPSASCHDVLQRP
jgi:hypothetical protein